MSTRALYTFIDEDNWWNVYKHHDGYIRFMPPGDPKNVAKDHYLDIEYRYEISAAKGKLRVEAYKVDAWGNYSERKLFSGTLAAFTAWAKKDREAA